MSIRPRRARAQWLDDDCPAGVLAIFDNGGKTFDRFTVLYVPTVEQLEAGYIEYLGASEHPFDPQGFGQHGEFATLWDCRSYRYAATSAHESAKWSTLPDDVKRAVRADLAEREEPWAGHPDTPVSESELSRLIAEDEAHR